MPKLNWEKALNQIKANQIWPIYWLYGAETYLIRTFYEFLKTHLHLDPYWGEMRIDAEIEGAFDLIQPSLFLKGVQLIQIKNAEKIRKFDFFQECSQKMSSIQRIYFFVSKDGIFQAKDFLTQVAVIHCEKVKEFEQEHWIQFLAQEKGLNLTSEIMAQFNAFQPWSLDRINEELEKLKISGMNPHVISCTPLDFQNTDEFLDGFFSKEPKKALSQLTHFFNHSHQMLTLLGIVNWNLKEIFMKKLGISTGVFSLRKKNIQRWANDWEKEELILLQNALIQIDYQLKQSASQPLETWTQLILDFCQKA